MAKSKNDFLLELLGLQQDGQHSISRPDRWDSQIPLAVSTEAGRFLIEHAEEFVSTDLAKTGRWHFLVGSPGNGKSAAVGELYRHLKQKLKCDFKSSEDADGNSIPYRQEVYRAGESFARLWLVQDASAVKDPTSSGLDAAALLAETLRDAQKKGVSLIVCANRGVLERAYDQCRYQENEKEPWVAQVLLPLLKDETERLSDVPFTFEKSDKKQPFLNVKVGSHSLDYQNLMRGSNSPMQLLLEKAVDSENWKPCDKCKNAKYCPFFGNAKSLRGAEWLNSLLTILRRAEVWSGQTIVFREAVSLVGYLLAGCPHDYGKQGHPCDWVTNKISEGNFFALLGRRIYAAIFGTPEPCGLDSDEHKREEQKKIISDAVEKLDDSLGVSERVKAFLAADLPSTDVGASRLVGVEGVFRQFDSALLSNHAEIRDAWSLYNAVDSASEHSGITELDKLAMETWKELDLELEESTVSVSRDAQLVVSRWASSFLVRLGGFVDVKSQVWSQELDEFIALLDAVRINPPQDEETLDRLEEAGELVTKTLARCNKELPDGVKISSCVFAKGPAATRLAKADVLPETDQPGLAIGISFGGSNSGKNKPLAYLNGQHWAWLRRVDAGLLPVCIPVELFQGLEIAQTRAVIAGKYAEDDGTVIVINDENGRSWELYQNHGQVRVKELPS
jgi:hypothetical protein